MKYQVGTVAPYWIKTQILRRKGLTPPQLYKFDQYSEGQTEEYPHNGKESQPNVAETTTTEKVDQPNV